MKKMSTTSLAVAVGLGVMLSPAVAGAQEESGTQPGTATPVESTEEESADSDNAGVQPGTETPVPEVEDTSQPVESTVQPGTEAPATEHAESDNQAGQSQPGTAVEAPVEQPVDQPSQQSQPGTEASQQPTNDVSVEDAVVEQPVQQPQPVVETPAEPVEPVESPAVEYVPAVQQEENAPAAHEVPVEEVPTEPVDPVVDEQSTVDTRAVEDAQAAAENGEPVSETPAESEAVEQPVQQPQPAVETPAEPVERVVDEQVDVEEVAAEPVTQKPQGIAGANVNATGYGTSVGAAIDTTTSGVQADISGHSIESSTASGVVVNDTELASAEVVQQSNIATEKAVNALPAKVTAVTDTAYDGVQDRLAELPEQHSIDAAGVSADLHVQHWN